MRTEDKCDMELEEEASIALLDGGDITIEEETATGSEYRGGIIEEAACTPVEGVVGILGTGVEVAGTEGEGTTVEDVWPVELLVMVGLVEGVLSTYGGMTNGGATLLELWPAVPLLEGPVSEALILCKPMLMDIEPNVTADMLIVAILEGFAVGWGIVLVVWLVGVPSVTAV